MLGTQLGPYKIMSQLGAGGMGEVYLARDTKLNRDVAVKLLPAALAHDPDRLARLRREAHLLAALNHPNIAHIYGLEDSTDRPALVMELVSGRTLADLMAAGPIPLEDAIPIARQIAEALESAHERGIIHRDLKPANIKVRDDGTVKVLDFGLAKALDPVLAPDSPPAVDNSPTFTSPAVLGRGSDYSGTVAGVILGTAAYMAPEQAKGRPIDKRVDIWAFGVVLAEMLIGARLFAGDSIAETIASVIKEDPKLDRLPPATPARVRQLLSRCLERDPKNRLRDIGEARILLSQPLEPEAASTPAPARRRTWIAATVGGIALAALAAIAVSLARPAPSIPVRRFELPAELGAVRDGAISADGHRVAYILNGRLFVRSLDELDARELARVHVTASQLAWSPNGDTIAFTAEGTIQSIPAAGGPRFVVTKVPASGRVMGLAWLDNAHLVFSVWRDHLYTVPATGGTPVVRLAIDEATEIDFHHVSVLPDGRLVIATHRRKEDSDVVELVDGKERQVLTTDRGASWFEYVEPGVLVFRRSTTNPGVWAVPFDGRAIDMNSAVLVQAAASTYRVARDGTLIALVMAPSTSALVWVDRSGAETSVPGASLDASPDDLELSPDGNRVAFVHGRTTVAGSDGIGSMPDARIVVRDLQTGVDTRLTLASPDAGTWADAGAPVWIPGGNRLIHRTGNIERMNLVERRADVASDGRVLTSGFIGRVLPDTKTLVYVEDERGMGRLRSATITAEGVVNSRPIFTGDSQPNVREFDLSPDGRLIAYSAQQANRRGDIYLAALADMSARRLVHEGGARPRFAGNGELFFLSGGEDESGQPRGKLMRVAVEFGTSIVVSAPTDVLREVSNGPVMGSYDVAPGGDRFLMWKPTSDPQRAGSRLIFVQNALGALRR